MKTSLLPNRKIDTLRRKEILSEIKQSQAKYLITLGDEPLINFIKEFNPTIGKLSTFSAYGCIHKINIENIELDLIPLAHPRQVGALGTFNKDWFNKHKEWESTKAQEIKAIVNN